MTRRRTDGRNGAGGRMLIKPFSIKTDTCHVHVHTRLSSHPHVGGIFYNSRGCFYRQWEVAVENGFSPRSDET